LTGDSGIGKTTLADEFQRQAATDVPPIRLARGQCVEGYGGKEPYFPMLEALGELCHGPSGATIVQILASKAPSWLAQLPAALKREHRAILQQEIQGTTRERMLREIGEALEAIASSVPLLLVFEDLHLADPFTLDLLSATARRRASAKMMIVGTYRTCDIDPHHLLLALVRDLLVRRLSDEIVLEPLTESEIAEYLLCQPCSIQTPRVLAALLFRHSAGNPLFMAAFLEHLYNGGMLSGDKGILRLNVSLDAIDMGVPRSLGRMLEAQIDHLSLEQQQVLEVMSVDSVGRYPFPTAAKAAAIDMEPEVFETICETLSRRHHALHITSTEELPNGTSITCYEFVHALYRDVCYRRIPAARRAQLHRRIGAYRRP
jgi:predicted ATPase